MAEDDLMFDDLKEEKKKREDAEQRLRAVYVSTFQEGLGQEALANLLYEMNFFDDITTVAEAAKENQAKQILRDMGVFPQPGDDDYKKQMMNVMRALYSARR